MSDSLEGKKKIIVTVNDRRFRGRKKILPHLVFSVVVFIFEFCEGVGSDDDARDAVGAGKSIRDDSRIRRNGTRRRAESLENDKNHTVKKTGGLFAKARKLTDCFRRGSLSVGIFIF